MNMNINENELLRHLQRIEIKQDQALRKQDELTRKINQLHRDNKRTALISGGIAGGIAGGMVTMAVELIKLKVVG